MKLSSIFFSFVLMTLSACASIKAIPDITKDDKIARNTITNSNFSSHATKTEVIKKNFEGVIVALDKVDLAKLDLNPEDYKNPLTHQIKAYDKTYFNFSESALAPSERFKKRVRKTLFKQNENIFVTGVFANDVGQNISFEMTDSCSENLNAPSSYIACSANFLDELEGLVSSALRASYADPYTHVILHSTGWNNTPEDSIKHYQDLQTSLANLPGENIKPLFVGLTWPSEWNVPFISLFNKKNDSDEMGLVWLNYLMNKTIPNGIYNANLKNPPKFIAIGHSLGARAMATAAYSRPYLIGASETKLDSLILLQPAFSSSRFYTDPDKKNLGHFKYYAGIEKFVPSIVVTSSKYDKAVRLARWADNFTGHIGGGKAHTRTCKKVLAEKNNPALNAEKYWDSRYVCQQQGDGTESQWGELSREDDRILFLRLDAGEKCEGEDEEKHAAIVCDHSDVKGSKMARVIWELIK